MKKICDFWFSGGRKIFIFSSLTILLAFFSYAGAIDGDFVFDDVPLISSDYFYHEGADSTVWDCFARTYWRAELSQGLYRPLTVLSYLINAKTAGLYSPSFRIFNIFLHALVSLLVFFLALKLFKNRVKEAFLCSILFAVHPLHCEAVAPASGRADLLCAFFLLCGIISHAGDWRWRKYAVFAFCLLACLSKENGVVLLILCPLYDIFFRRKEFAGILRNKDRKNMTQTYISCLFAVLSYFFIKIYFFSALLPISNKVDLFTDNQLALMSFWERLPTALWLQFFAIFKFIWPAALSHDYSYAQIIPIESFSDYRLLPAIFFLILLCVFVVFARRGRMPVELYCVLAYIVSVLPVSNIPIAIGTIFGERLYYFPSVFLCILAVSVFAKFAKRLKTNKYMLALVVAAVFSALFARLAIREKDWKNPMTLAVAGTKSSPSSNKIWNNYAVQLATAGNVAEAEAACTRAIEIYPKAFTALRNRAYYRIKLGKNTEALEDLKKCMEVIGLKDVEVFNKAGAICAVAEDYDSAERYWKLSLSITPGQRQIINALHELKNKKSIKKEKK
jgi:tetratricopeptide (TPR) repeat protein